MVKYLYASSQLFIWNDFERLSGSLVTFECQNLRIISDQNLTDNISSLCLVINFDISKIDDGVIVEMSNLLQATKS